MIAPSGTIALVLAAGLSQRFGGDKLLAPLQGKPLAAHVAATVAGLDVSQRIAICSTRAERQAIFAAQGFEIIENGDPGRGMASSLALGAQRALGLGAERMLVCLADMPFVTAAHLLQLMAADGNVVATAAGGVRSPPAVFLREVFPALTLLTGDSGARHLLQAAAVVEATPAMVRDFDLPSDFG
ncbi:nucleotidyltransferase family protein [Devosia sp.]|uniref:nucleotidyltransferase family protein n=1 Tax=Devosia sp. TaxID=1871048 RepID=UPI0037C0CD5F